MSEGMLGRLPLSEIRGLRDTLEDRLAGKDGEEWLTALKRFLRREDPLIKPGPLWRKAARNAIDVNLNALPRLLVREEAPLAWLTFGLRGWVRVTLDSGRLLVGHREVVLYLTEGQKTGTIPGHNLRKELEGKVTLHPNILDALVENPYLIPESWKLDEQGRRIFIHFWAAGFSDPSDDPCVLTMSWLNDRWYGGFSSLDDEFDNQRPAAILEEPVLPKPT